MKETIKTMLPQSFEVINGIPYFRLEDGKIAVETIKKVIIEASKEECVELITLEVGKKKIRFWKANGNIYAMSSSSSVKITEDTTFVECYFSNNYPEGCYVKYVSSGKCGILYVSETQISTVIDCKYGYTDITFENSQFYAESTADKNEYYVIGESGKILGKFPSKCKKLDNYMIFYDEKKIFIDSSTEFEIPGGVSSVEIIKQKNITLVKVVNSNGIYYYTRGIEYLFGPIVKDEIKYITENSCHIYEKIDEKITKVFYVIYKKETYTCESIACDTGIQVYMEYNRRTDKNDSFYTTDNTLYSFLEKEKKFVPILTGIAADSYKCSVNSFLHSDEKKWGIVAIKNNKPVNASYYESGSDHVISPAMLEVIDSDWEGNGFICKSDKSIFVISKDFKIVFSAEGIKCSKKKFGRKDSWGYPEVYLVEEEKKYIYIYNKNGEMM